MSADPLGSQPVASLAASLARECDALPEPSTEARRRIRRAYSRSIANWDAAAVRRLVDIVQRVDQHKWVAYELLASHAAFDRVGVRELERLGKGLHDWWTVDAFARTLSGPAWLRRQISDRAVEAWARRRDVWWRRTALVSTVALNTRSLGGTGDARRTLRICALLVGDDREMVVKAMSWALRALVVHDSKSVGAFVTDHASELTPLVRREVANKLRTDLRTTTLAASGLNS